LQHDAGKDKLLNAAVLHAELCQLVPFLDMDPLL